MEQKTKLIFGVTLTLLILLPFAAIALADVYGQATNGSWATNKENALQLLGLQLQQRNPFLRGWFLKEAAKSTITGNILAYSGHIIVLKDSQVERNNVILAGQWNIDSKILTIQQLFSEGYLSIGDEITISVLTRTATNRNGVSLTIIFGYAIYTIATDNYLYAIQPLNIQN